MVLRGPVCQGRCWVGPADHHEAGIALRGPVCQGRGRAGLATHHERGMALRGPEWQERGRAGPAAWLLAAALSLRPGLLPLQRCPRLSKGGSGCTGVTCVTTHGRTK